MCFGSKDKWPCFAAKFSVCVFSNLGLLCHAGALAFARTAHKLSSSLTLAFTVRISRSVRPTPSRDPVFGLVFLSFICLAMPEPDPEAFAAFMANFQQMTAENQRIASLVREQSQPSPSTHSAQTAETEAMPQTADAQPSHEPLPEEPSLHPGPQSPGQMHWPPTLLAYEALPSAAVEKPSTAPAPKAMPKARTQPKTKARPLQLAPDTFQDGYCAGARPAFAFAFHRARPGRAFDHRTLLRLLMNRSRKRGRAASAGAGMVGSRS